MLHSDFLSACKGILNKSPFPPQFNEKLWKGIDCNCYAYALNLAIDTPDSCVYFEPGCFSKGGDNDYRHNESIVLNYFAMDCTALGLQVKPTTLKEQITTGYKIAVYLRPSWIRGGDFHFARQDNKGWSEKHGWFNAPQKSCIMETISC